MSGRRGIARRPATVAVLALCAALPGCTQRASESPSDPTAPTAAEPATTTTAAATTISTSPPTATTVPPLTTTTTAAATTSTAPPTSAPATTTTTTEPLRRTVTVEAPLRVWVVGDSLAGPLGGEVAALGAETGLFDVHLDYRSGSGLVTPWFFDWPARISEGPANPPAEAIVVHLGANDGEAIRIEGESLAPGTPEWFEAYEGIVATFMDLLLEQAEVVYWLGLPPMQGARYNERIVEFNALYARLADGRSGLAYVDSFGVLGDSNGDYTAQLPDPAGGRMVVREPDGVHYTRAGARLLAARVSTVIAADWGLPHSSP
jgi:hypothetical protein